MELKRIFGISESTVSRLLKRGMLPHHRIFDRIIFTEADIADFLDSCAVPATAPTTSRERLEIARNKREIIFAAMEGEPPRCYGRKEFSELTGLSVTTLDRLLKRGRLPHHRVGDRIVFTESDCAEFFESCAVPAANSPGSGGGGGAAA